MKFAMIIKLSETSRVAAAKQQTGGSGIQLKSFEKSSLKKNC
jgi:hypothetical protein